jgi:Xaa-Pro aminopeptidase
MNKKIKVLQKHLKEKKIDYCLLINSKNKDYNFIYFAGFDIDSCLLIPKKGKAEILISEMEYDRAKKESKIKRIKKFSRGKKLREYLKNKLDGKIVGVNYETVTLNSAKRFRKFCKVRDISKELNEIRAVKTDEEIKNIKKACNTTSKIMKKCLKNFKRFKTEKDVESFLIKETEKNKCELAFEPVVASGSGASMPHYKARKVKLRKGFCVIDFGVKYKRYHSDLTRTIYIGYPSKNEVNLYYNVLWLQEQAIKMSKPGTKVKKIDSYVRDRLKNFIHGLGHGVGVEIHELPNLTEESEDVLKKNMVFTIEPGTYKEKKYGIRIEDTVLLKDKKSEILTKVDKELIVIK